jgi:hypothetical protein
MNHNRKIIEKTLLKIGKGSNFINPTIWSPLRRGMIDTKKNKAHAGRQRVKIPVRDNRQI